MFIFSKVPLRQPASNNLLANSQDKPSDIIPRFLMILDNAVDSWLPFIESTKASESRKDQIFHQNL
ncbi:hypothetical protein CVS40_11481 [Lucilia cuprina]|nr:hypothetical protein CVS40_11481 [Lucilia cuprina]